jgi:hypothetical protein
MMPNQTPEDEAYAAGRDCALFGPDMINCHVRHFATPELKAAWEAGRASVRKDGDADR